MSETKSERLWTYKDYLGWPAEERWELIEGRAFNMTPAPSWRHQQIVGELFFQIRSRLEGHPCKTAAAPIDVRLALPGIPNEEVMSVVQPDIVVVCDPSKIDDRGVRGAPDIVVEVISPSSATRDTLEKRALYERHGVPEYWIIDTETQRVFALVLDKGRYSEPQILSFSDTLESVHHQEIRIDLNRVFAQ